jgi:hypothetical protein
MLIPHLQELNLVFPNNLFNLTQLVGSEAIVGRQSNRVKPEFGLVFSGFDMNVGRFFAFIAEEVKAVSPNA